MSDSGFLYEPNSIDSDSKKQFFPVCIDNFFSDPDAIRDFALSLNRTSDVAGNWPGERTDPLHIIDREFFNAIILKALSAYFDLKHTNLSWDDSDITFQLIPPNSDKRNDPVNVGWIHKDLGNNLAGLIYLTPDADPDSGTSLFNIKPEFENIYLDHGRQPEKHIWELGDQITNEEYIEALEKHNNMFYEKTRFQNIYNRLIMYDANEFHRANNFVTGTKDRLTCVFFISGVKAGFDANKPSRYPMDRVLDKYNFDDKLSSRIKNLRERNNV